VCHAQSRKRIARGQIAHPFSESDYSVHQSGWPGHSQVHKMRLAVSGNPGGVTRARISCQVDANPNDRAINHFRELDRFNGSGNCGCDSGDTNYPCWMAQATRAFIAHRFHHDSSSP
jgi:hypothetical protein